MPTYFNLILKKNTHSIIFLFQFETFSDLENTLIPKSIAFPVQLGFDRSFYKYFNRNGTAATQFINEVIELSSQFFSQPDSKLPIITFDIESEILALKRIRFRADQMCSDNSRPSRTGRRKMNRIHRIRKRNSKPLILFTQDLRWDGAQITACSFNDIACGDENGNSLLVLDITWSRNSLDQHKQEMARSLAHEFGHMVNNKKDQIASGS